MTVGLNEIHASGGRRSLDALGKYDAMWTNWGGSLCIEDRVEESAENDSQYSIYVCLNAGITDSEADNAD
jgi:hypothetical protein